MAWCAGEPPPGPLHLYGAALRRADAGRTAVLHLVTPQGEAVGRVDAAEWSADVRPGDESMLRRCRGATLDVGCGPGRLTAALHRRGHSALGVDICPEAVRLARRRGAPVQRADVFARLPLEGRWRSVLLADGNIGIGGDPPRLLRRCARLLGRRGSVLVELHPAGAVSWAGALMLHDGQRCSAPFPWAQVAAHDLAGQVARTGLRIADEWMESGRWFARLVRA